MGFQDILFISNKNCKHTESGNCLQVSMCNAYGCPDKKGFHCDHKNIFTKVICTSFGVKTTVDCCTDCQKHLSEPKTDCR